MRKVLYIFIAVFFYGVNVFAQQTNVAPQAAVSCSDPWNWQNINDLDFGTCGTQLAFVWTTGPPSPTIGVDWMLWEWPNPVFIDTMIIHHANATSRSLTGGLIQVWNNGNWVTHHHFTNLPQQCSNVVAFPPVATGRLRITAFEMTGSGQNSNPNFREIEIIEAPPNDAGIHEINAPGVPNCLSKDVYVTLETVSMDPLTSVRVEWSVNGANQTPYYWTGYLPPNPPLSVAPQPIYLGDFPFQQGDEIKVWTANPNGDEDKWPNNDTATFTIPSFNTANMPSEELLCPGESKTLQTGVGFASHQWSTGQTSSSISVTQGGIYEVTITDASTGCNHDYSVNVIEAPQVNLSDTTVWGCKIDGGVSLQGNVPRASYLWSTGSNATRITVQNSGTYWVQAIDPSQQCMSSDTVDVEIYELPNPEFETERNFSTVIFKNLTQDATSYFWRFGDGGTSTEENPTHLYVAPGTYEVRLTASNLCGSLSMIKDVGADPVSIGENTALREISLYPNPNSGLLNIELNADRLENAEVEILDLQGRLIENLNLGTVTGHHKTEVSLHNLSSGVYIVKIIGNGETVSVDRVVLK